MVDLSKVSTQDRLNSLAKTAKASNSYYQGQSFNPVYENGLSGKRKKQNQFVSSYIIGKYGTANQALFNRPSADKAYLEQVVDQETLANNPKYAAFVGQEYDLAEGDEVLGEYQGTVQGVLPEANNPRFQGVNYFGDGQPGEPVFRPVTRSNTLSVKTLSLMQQQENGVDLPYEMTVIPVQRTLKDENGQVILDESGQPRTGVFPVAQMREHVPGQIAGPWQHISMEYARDFPEWSYDHYQSVVAMQDRLSDPVLSAKELAMTFSAGSQINLQDEHAIADTYVNSIPKEESWESVPGEHDGEVYRLRSLIGRFNNRHYDGQVGSRGTSESKLHGIAYANDLKGYASNYQDAPMSLEIERDDYGVNHWHVVVLNENGDWERIKGIRDLNLPGVSYETYQQIFDEDARLDLTLNEWMDNLHLSNRETKSLLRSITTRGIENGDVQGQLPSDYVIPANNAQDSIYAVENLRDLGHKVEVEVNRNNPSQVTASLDSAALRQGLLMLDEGTRDGDAIGKKMNFNTFSYTLTQQGTTYHYGTPRVRSHFVNQDVLYEGSSRQNVLRQSVPDNLALTKALLGHAYTNDGRYAGDLVNYETTYQRSNGNTQVDHLAGMLTSKGIFNYAIHQNNYLRDGDEVLELDEMIAQVNDKLKALDLPEMTASAENNYEGLSLDLMVQVFNSKQVVQALQAHGFTQADVLSDHFSVSDDGTGNPVVLSDLETEDAGQQIDLNERVLSAVEGDRINSLDQDEANYLQSHFSQIMDVYQSYAGYEVEEFEEIENNILERLNVRQTELENQVGESSLNEAFENMDVQGLNESLDDGIEDPDDVDDESLNADQAENMKLELAQSMVGEGQVLGFDELAPAQQEFLDQARQWISESMLTSEQANQVVGPGEEGLHINVAFDEDHVMHWQVLDANNEVMVRNNRALSGKVGQIFLPDEDGLVRIKYTQASPEIVAVPGYEGRYISNNNAWNDYKRMYKGREEEMEWQSLDEFIAAESDNLPYRFRAHGFQEGLEESVKRELALQSQDLKSTDFDTVTSLNRLYRGDSYFTRITNPVLENPQSKERALILDHLKSKVHFDKTLLDDPSRYIGEKDDLNATMRIIPESMRAHIFDPVAGGTGGTIGLNFFMSQYAQENLDEKGQVQNLLTDEELEANPELGYSNLLRNSDLLKYHVNDPLNRTIMAVNQMASADTLLPDTNVAFMGYKGYTMDDGTVITQDFAKKVGRIRAREYGQAMGMQNAALENFVEAVGNTSTKDKVMLGGVEYEGFALSMGDKLSTTHGNKATISKIIDPNEAGNEFFLENPEVEMLMAPEAMLSRMNLGEATEQMGHEEQPKPLIYHGQTVGYQGKTTVLDTDIKASHKVHVYENEIGGRRVGNQMVWSLLANDANAVYKEFFQAQKGNLKDMRSLLNGIGMHYDMASSQIHFGNEYSDEVLNQNPEGVNIIDVSNPDARKRFGDNMPQLPVSGGYIKLPGDFNLVSKEDAGQDVKSQYLYVLPEKLRSAQDMVSGRMINHEYTKFYEMVLDRAMKGSLDVKTVDAENRPLTGEALVAAQEKSAKTISQQVGRIQDAIIQDSFGGQFGETKKSSFIRRNILAATVKDSATAPATNASDVALDTVRVSPEIYANLHLNRKVDQNGEPIYVKNKFDEVLMVDNKPLEASDDMILVTRDPALHAGSTMAFKVEVDPEISGMGIHPLVVKTFGGDFDGDTYSITAPHKRASQKELREKLSLDAYLKDMAEGPHQHEKTIGGNELNMGMDAAAGAKALLDAGDHQYDNENSVKLDEVQDRYYDQLKQAYEEVLAENDGEKPAKWADATLDKWIQETALKQDKPAQELTNMWQSMQHFNVGVDHLDVSSPENVEKSLQNMVDIGAKGKDKSVKDSMTYFKKTQRDWGSALDKAVDGDVTMADGDIQKAMALQQDLTAKSGQAAIMLNQLFMDYDFKSKNYESVVKTFALDKTNAEMDKAQENGTDFNYQKSLSENQEKLQRLSPVAIVTEMTEQVTQTALQVKHDPTDAVWVDEFLNNLNKLVKKPETQDKDRMTRDDWRNRFDEINAVANDAINLTDNQKVALSVMFAYNKTTGEVQDKVLTQEELAKQASPLQRVGYGSYKDLTQVVSQKAFFAEGKNSQVMLSGMDDQKDGTKGQVALQSKLIEKAQAGIQAQNRGLDYRYLKSEEIVKVQAAQGDYIQGKVEQGSATLGYMNDRTRQLNVLINQSSDREERVAYQRQLEKAKLGRLDEATGKRQNMSDKVVDMTFDPKRGSRAYVDAVLDRSEKVAGLSDEKANVWRDKTAESNRLERVMSNVTTSVSSVQHNDPNEYESVSQVAQPQRQVQQQQSKTVTRRRDIAQIPRGDFRQEPELDL